MRYLIVVLIAILSFGCQNKENQLALEAIKKNNAFLSNEIETFKAIMHIKSLDYPKRYDSIYLKNLNSVVKKAFTIKDKAAYNTVYKSLIELAQKGKLKPNLHSIDSENIDILKNNLLLNLHELYNAYLNKYTYGCELTSDRNQYKIFYITNNDSVNLYFLADNPYRIITDSIVNEQDKTLKYNFNTDVVIGKIKYQTASKKTKYYGKIFFQNEIGKPIFLQNFEQEIIKQDNLKFN